MTDWCVLAGGWAVLQVGYVVHAVRAWRNAPELWFIGGLSMLPSMATLILSVGTLADVRTGYQVWLVALVANPPALLVTVALLLHPDNRPSRMLELIGPVCGMASSVIAFHVAGTDLSAV